KALRLVIAGAWTGAGNEAAIRLGRRDRIRRRISVYLTRRIEQKPLDRSLPLRLPHAVLEEIPQTVDVGIDGLERVFPIERRRGNTGGVNYPLVIRHRLG